MIIKSYERGLLFKNEEFIQLLMPGSHFMFNLRNLKIYNITEPFVITTETLLHLKDISLQNELILTDVKDNEICLHYEEDKFKSVLKTGVHAYWKCQIKHSFFKIDLNNPYIDPQIEKQVFLKPEIFAYINCFIVENFEKGLLFIDKKFDNILNPGEYYFWKGSKNIRIEKVDMRQQQIEIAGQEIMSKDKITLRLNFVCQLELLYFQLFHSAQFQHRF